MNKKTEAKSPQTDNLQVIANELTAIRKLLFEKTKFQLGSDSETLTSLLKAKENKNGKK